tara:strand:- start:3139 stop:3708 length:570 start_codon:yes stop_codon:yes gene_type:complete
MKVEEKLDGLYSENSFSGKWRTTPEDTKLLADSTHSLYGEIKRQTVDNIVNHFKQRFNKKAVFYDIGSGLGKMVLHIGLKYGIESYGIELSQNKHKGALELKEKFCKDSKNIHFINNNFFTEDLSKATIIYFDNTVMEDNFFNQIYDKLSKDCLIMFRRKVYSIESECLMGNEWSTQYGTKRLRYIIKK